jgi:hypothetical protein
MIAAAKSEDLGFPSPYPENFSKAAAHNELISGDLRPILLENSKKMDRCFSAENQNTLNAA